MSRLVQRDVRLGNKAFGLQASPVRVQVATIASAAAGASTNQTDTDDYATRLVKYIPAEVVAFYLAADKLFAKGAELTDSNIAEAFVAKHLFYFSVAVFIIALIGTPIYLRQQRTADDQPWQVQAAISTLAFVVWSYAVQGQIFVSLYSSAIAALLVLVFTFASGFVKPGR
jgi:hypothetical protein